MTGNGFFLCNRAPSVIPISFSFSDWMGLVATAVDMVSISFGNAKEEGIFVICSVGLMLNDASSLLVDAKRKRSFAACKTELSSIARCKSVALLRIGSMALVVNDCKSEEYEVRVCDDVDVMSLQKLCALCSKTRCSKTQDSTARHSCSSQADKDNFKRT